jgi:hypothetical protein
VTTSNARGLTDAPRHRDTETETRTHRPNIHDTTDSSSRSTLVVALDASLAYV